MAFVITAMFAGGEGTFQTFPILKAKCISFERFISYKSIAACFIYYRSAVKRALL